MGNIDWSKPIEFVSGEYTYPADDRGAYGDSSRVVVVDFRDHHAIIGTNMQGHPYRKYVGYDGYIRNIPEPKREPREVWLLEDRHGNLTGQLAIDAPLFNGPRWRKFVEEVE